MKCLDPQTVEEEVLSPPVRGALIEIVRKEESPGGEPSPPVRGALIEMLIAAASK